MAGARSEQPESLLLGMDMPKDVRTYLIYPFTPIDMLGLFARTCKKAEAETALPRLLHCAAFALPESRNQADKTKLAAIAILKRHPELLFQKGYTRDPAGHLIYGSVYQVFLGAGDIWALKTIHEQIIPLIEGGAAKALEQYLQQFPNPTIHAFARLRAKDYTLLQSLEIKTEELQSKIQSILCKEEMQHDDINKALIAQVTEDLNEIAAAISADHCTNGKPLKTSTINAIRKLHEHLAPKNVAIQTGLYSPPEILKIIHDIYHQHFPGWSGNQANAYSVEVIGGAERVASAVDAQCYKKGLSTFDIQTSPDRTLSYFSRSGVPSNLGSSFFIDVNYGDDACYFPACGTEDAFGTFLSGKKSELAKLFLLHPQPRREENTSLCVIL